MRLFPLSLSLSPTARLIGRTERAHWLPCLYRPTLRLCPIMGLSSVRTTTGERPRHGDISSDKSSDLLPASGFDIKPYSPFNGELLCMVVGRTLKLMSPLLDTSVALNSHSLRLCAGLLLSLFLSRGVARLLHFIGRWLFHNQKYARWLFATCCYVRNTYSTTNCKGHSVWLSNDTVGLIVAYNDAVPNCGIKTRYFVWPITKQCELSG